MARSIDSSFYKSKAWKQVRKTYALSKHCICERCGMPVYVDGINDYLIKEHRTKGIVHHKEHLNQNNVVKDNIAYGFDNLELLCIECHNKEHFDTGILREGFTFDENGNLKTT